MEIYLNQSSSFLSEHNNPFYQVTGVSEEEQKVYQSQKEKNEKIVRECRELLGKLE